MEGAVFAQKAGWQGATRENIPGESSTEEQLSQATFSAKSLLAAVLLAAACVGSALGDGYQQVNQCEGAARGNLVFSRRISRKHPLKLRYNSVPVNFWDKSSACIHGQSVYGS
ncbi:hypothetical protein [Pedosphaera parvula]|uniref:Uncharacterized protein n=1 Tax=Pedosphaera parvula (strain Ellin514) TaxID=320771 RepID=B9XR14_PEDPL|nr:hypothetical protein [Pedosphaera parvula]EEF57710.1 hypothetical protein Cflav_PD0772 [Pedosphaera parvula Ellin514]